MSKTVNGIVIGVIAAIAVITVFTMRGCEGSDRGATDEKNRVADSVRALATDSMNIILRRSNSRLTFVEAQLVLIESERNVARAQNVVLTNRVRELRRTPGGGSQLPPRDSVPGDTTEVVGPRTTALIDDLVAQNARLTGIVSRDSTVQDSLKADNADLRRAVTRGIEALVESEKEVNRLKRDRYGWRDRITVGPHYGAQVRKVDGEYKVDNGWGVSVQYAAVRPLRHLPKWPRWLGGKPDG